MVLRRSGWRVIASAAVCFAAAGAMFVSGSVAGAMDLGASPMPRGEIPMAAPLVTGGVAPRLMWGGPVPEAARPGEVPVYVPSASAFPSHPQPQPELALPPEVSPAPDWQPATRRAAPRASSDVAALPPIDGDPLIENTVPLSNAMPTEELAPFEEAEPVDGEASGASSRTLYEPRSEETPAETSAMPPLDAPVDVEDGGALGVDQGFGGAGDEPRVDPWSGLKQVTPGALPPKRQRVTPERSRPSYAALERMAPKRRVVPQQDGGSILDRRRGALERETPTGYSPMPKSEAMCRKALKKLGVGFVDAASISRSRSCGIDYPVKVSDIAPGIAMRPAATLNCMAALRVAQWMKEEVKPAARWKLLKRPTVLVNASSYRCSRIAGSRSISEHASGNALDVRGFKFSDGSFMEIEKKGFFEFGQKAFQSAVRESACRYFGTVLGPGFNRAHADHLHLDAKQRRRVVCK